MTMTPFAVFVWFLLVAALVLIASLVGRSRPR
jgi:uncharacterized oligopeptide transporter (OPT) family protein